jgi:hypothetical protein
MFSMLLSLTLIFMATAHTAAVQTSPNGTFAVHNITRNDALSFENLAIRSNGQILVTTTTPNASIYSVDPLGILPFTLINNIYNISSATAIVEGAPDIFYVLSGDISLKDPLATTPSSYTVLELDMQNVKVLPNGQLNMNPRLRRAAHLPEAALPNGAAFSRPGSQQLLVADSFRGLIWNVNVVTGQVGVALNDTTTKGPTATGPGLTGINGVKVFNETLYWTNTGRSSLFKIPINADGSVLSGAAPTLVTANLTCDDFAFDCKGNAYVAGPLDILTKVTPEGQKEIIAGTFNSTSSALMGPSAVRFGRLASDEWSIYVTTNGGLGQSAPGTRGVSRIDLGLGA